MAVSAATAGLMQRWVQVARDRQFESTRADLDDHMDRLEDIVGPQLHEANDWYFGRETRERGEELVVEGNRLLQERDRGAKEAEHKARRALLEFDERRTEQHSKSRTEREDLREAWEHEVRTKDNELSERVQNLLAVVVAKDTRLRKDHDLSDAPAGQYEMRPSKPSTSVLSGESSRVDGSTTGGRGVA